MSNKFVISLSNRKLLVDVLAVLFGIAAWIGVNGIYVQLPILVHSTPEGWDLAAYMVMVVQVANLGPIFYTLYSKYSSWSGDHYIIYGLLGAATLAIYLMAFTYRETSMIFGERHSTALLGLMLVSAIMSCTSSVLFMPYMRNYREIYLVSYLVGEGLSGFIPSLVALIQGVGGNLECNKPIQPMFSTEVFLLFLGTFLLAGFLAFVGLNVLRVARGERVKPPGCTEVLPTDVNAPPSYKTDAEWTMTRQTYSYLLLMMAIICFLGHSALPGIQSYSCLPYGNVAYHLTVTLASMATPLAMCYGFIRPQALSVRILTAFTGGILLLSAFVLYLALQSPYPPLRDSWVGVLIVVVVWILIHGLIGLIKMSVTTIFRQDPGRGLYYTGISMQIGSLAGALVTLSLLKNNIFQSYDPCAIEAH